jgi:hypothetical protein
MGLRGPQRNGQAQARTPFCAFGRLLCARLEGVAAGHLAGRQLLHPGEVVLALQALDALDQGTLALSRQVDEGELLLHRAPRFASVLATVKGSDAGVNVVVADALDLGAAVVVRRRALPEEAAGVLDLVDDRLGEGLVLGFKGPARARWAGAGLDTCSPRRMR